MIIKKIFHIVNEEEWKEAIENGVYNPPSVELEGFIHFSKEGQVEKVANSYYKDQVGLVLLHTEIEKLVPELKWESSDGDIFPHVYGPLNLEAVIKVEVLIPGEGGKYSYPQD